MNQENKLPKASNVSILISLSSMFIRINRYSDIKKREMFNSNFYKKEILPLIITSTFLVCDDSDTCLADSYFEEAIAKCIKSGLSEEVVDEIMDFSVQTLSEFLVDIIKNIPERVDNTSCTYQGGDNYLIKNIYWK